MNSSGRIVLNTISQVLKTVVGIVLGLYSTRIILEGLGESDFGIYSLLAGIVGLLAFLNNALSTTTQRFLSFNQNIKTVEHLKGIFANSVIVHIILAFTCLCVLEIVGVFLFDGELNIPDARIPAAKFVFHCAVVMAILTLMAAPFRAILVSHENMIFTSLIDTIDAVLKLVVAFIVLDSELDHLRLYALLTTCISIFSLICFIIYSSICYEEFTFPKRGLYKKNTVAQITKFAGWSIYSSFCIIGRNQGMAVVINKFFNTIVNASYGIALQVSAAVSYLSSAFLNSVAPPLTKAAGQGNKSLMIQLAVSSSKISYLIMAGVAIPLIARLEEILKIWLGSVPENAVLFCDVILIAAMVDQLSTGLSIANKAYGKLKRYSLIVDSMKILVIPIFYLLIYFGVSISTAFWVYALMEAISVINRIYVMKSFIDISFRGWFRNVFAVLLLPTLFIVTLYWATEFLKFNLISYGIQVICISAIYCIIIYFTATDNFEKQHLKALVSKFSRKR